MGIDIEVYTEKRENEKWVFFMPKENFSKNGCGYCRSLDVGGRIPVLFQVLSKLYDKGYDEDFKVISDNRGVPMDACEEIKFYMEDLVGCSYVSLKEILDFDWDSESRMYGIYREIVGDEFFDIVVRHMQTALSENISEDDIRIVFGYSS